MATKSNKGLAFVSPTERTPEVPADTESGTTKQAFVATKEKKTNMSESRSIIEYAEDLSGAEAPAPLPASDYPAEIRGAEVKTSDKGNDYLSVTFFIAPEAYPADYTDGNPDGTTLSYNRVMVSDNQQGRYRMRKFLEAVGGSLGRQLDVNSLIGLTAVVVVKNGEFEGEPRAEIAKVKSA